MTQAAPATAAPSVPNPHPGMGFREFVALIALMMAANAFAIDAMLPALPAIGHALGIATDNERQWVITSYMLGFGVAQIVYGTLADRYGRKPILIFGLGAYVVFSTLAAFSNTFETLMIARVLQGAGAASTRVLAVSIVRDCYSGRNMARVMSLTFIVFLGIPIIAPSLGQAILLFGPWQWIFGVLAIFGGSVLLWAVLRLPETLHPEDRTQISVFNILRSFKIALSNRVAVGYMLAMTAMFGSLIGFINSAQQVFTDTFHQEKLFPAIFAMVAFFIAVSSLLNSRIVGRLGMRKVSHAALIGYTTVAGIHALVAWTGHETIVTFAILQSCMMFCFGLVASNFGAMAMEPVGHIAGTASSLQGFITTVGGALIGFYIGQHFDGTAVPLTLGFIICGLLTLGIVVITERGKLFRPAHAPLAAE